MRLMLLQDFLRSHNMPYTYTEEDGCGSIVFIHRGLNYHIWEFPESDPGAQSNVRTAGRSEEFGENYQQEILQILQQW